MTSMTLQQPSTPNLNWRLKQKSKSGIGFVGHIVICLVANLILPAISPAQEAAVVDQSAADQQAASNTNDSNDDANASTRETGLAEPPFEKARRTYLDRIVAQPMSHRGASWLIRPERDDEENASESFQKLDLTPGMTVVDLGCGNGYWSLPMAGTVGKEGRVLAVDIQREMLHKLRARGDRAKLRNIELILGKVNDPRLPANEVDLVLMVDVYHEFSHPESMLWSIRRSLKPEGVVALLEYREEDPTVPIKPLHKMSKRQIMKEYTKNGFKLVKEYNGLPWQHLMFFARDDSPLDEIDPVPAKEVLRQIYAK